jgi:hypothetical protein
MYWKSGGRMTKIDKSFSDKCDELIKNLPKPLTQTEEIVWHKFPEEKPPNDELRRYLLEVASVSFQDGIISFSSHEFVEATYYPKGMMINHDPHWERTAIQNRVILSWALLPKGWQE